MASLLAVVGICRSVGGSLSSSVLQYRSSSDEGLDGRVPPSPSAADPLPAEFSAAAPNTPNTRTFGADTRNRNAYPLGKQEKLRGCGTPRVVRTVRLTRTVLIEEERPILTCTLASRNVTEESRNENHGVRTMKLTVLNEEGNVAEKSLHDSPRRGFISGKELPVVSACGHGNTHLPSARTTSEAIAILKHRQEQGLSINSYMFVDILKRCARQKDLTATRQVHDYIYQTKMRKNPYVVTTLLGVYVKCDRLQDARRVFDGLERTTRDVFAWNVMIDGYAKSGCGVEAYRLFLQMNREGFIPDAFTYASILNASASAGALDWVKEVHDHARRAGLESNLRVGNGLVHMYAKSGSIDDARGVFDRMEERDAITWNIMIGAYAESGCGMEAYRLFVQMNREGFTPNSFTYASILNASASAGALDWVKEVHGHARRAGLESNLRVGNALVHMYVKSGRIDDARVVFDRMEERNVITWTIMIGGYAESGCGMESYRLFLQMNREGFIPDALTYVSILNVSASAGALDWVKEVHGHARRAGLESNLRVGNALVHMYARSGSIDDARLVFDRMEERDAFTYASILNASASAGALDWVKEVHGHVRKAGLESDLRVGSALVHMYAKSGSIDDARLVFDRMEKRDAVTWNTMIGGLALHGCGGEALKLFQEMIADCVKPDESSFVAVLQACSHAGLVDDGRRIFSALMLDYGIEPTVVHYNCMVDILGRAGRLEEAKLLIDNMPLEADAGTWGALLGACRTFSNVELGEFAARERLKLEPMNCSTYVLLSNIYAAAGKWEKVSSVRTMMQERGVRKEPGRSWIEVDNKIHEFLVGDTSHPEAKAIYSELKKLTEQLKARGFIPETKLVLHNINEEEKELALCSHSEKLAIAYGLLRVPRGKPIRVNKNLRVCLDCHAATKLISEVTGREIIVRDANRFHHFKDGVCSCGDYW